MKWFFPLKIVALLSISTGAFVETTGTAEIGNALAVSIRDAALGDGLHVSIGSFVTTCYSSLVEDKWCYLVWKNCTMIQFCNLFQ